MKTSAKKQIKLFQKNLKNFKKSVDKYAVIPYNK